MRRLLASSAVALLVASATVGYAARLDLAPTPSTAGSLAVAPCDSDGVGINYHLAWRGHVVITRVEVSGIADRCVGRRLTAVLIVAGTPVDLGSVTVRFTRPNDHRATLVVDTDVRAVAAEMVHVSIT